MAIASTVKTGRRNSTPAPGRKAGFERAAAWARRAPLLPALVFMIAVTQLPFVVTVVISFFDWNALYPNDVKFGWFDNYVSVFTDESLRNSVLTTIVLTVVVVLVSLVLGLGIALLLDRHFWGRGIVRTILITPFLIVPVASALLWKHALFNPSYGLLNGILNWVGGVFGFQAPQPDWISMQPLGAIEVDLVWQWTPFMMLILLAGLQSRPLDVIEAARIDGASTWQLFRFMTLPHLRRYLELAALLGSIYIVQNFDAVFTITSGGLGTANLPYSIYQTFFLAHDYGAASAAGVVIVIGSLLLATFALRTVSTLLKEETR
ncbi:MULTISPECIES: sugar ABC transporter permease [unclassified Sinomonas]|uniref:carbohydrate ABC transporter permease n=1 Tax=unclassified Sinomonas TaxID=2646595 RepID=UPI0027DC8008|nr:sugar ABC transporter permease [Sinomonas sp. ASV322]MDQ4504436.1 sugar ABC transporter permease [Sinomonas sp. ASV322]